jgi:Ca2+-binding RTX toxin-like protein
MFRDEKWYANGPSTLISYLSDHFGLSAQMRLVEYTSLDAATGELTITGHGVLKNDVVTVERSGDDLVVTRTNGSQTIPHRFRASDVTSIVINTGAGDDRIYLESIQALIPVTVDAGADADVISVAQQLRDLVHLLGSTMNLDGGDGTDHLYLNDHGHASNVSYTITDNRITRPGSGQVTYAGLEHINLYASQGNNTINVQRTPAGTHLYAYANGGNDSVNVGGATLDAVQGPVHVFAGAGAQDGLTILDQVAGNSHARQFTISSGYVQRNGLERITYNSIEDLAVTTGASNDTFILASGVAVQSISGQGGNDTLDYSAWASPVQVNLATGSATGVHLGQAGGISGIENVIGGTGSDTLSGDNLANRLEGRLGHDTLAGGGGYDVLLGGEGNDRLEGGDGRDMLIGGNGADQVFGGLDEDILVAGRTRYDANLAALSYIFQEWSSGNSYRERVGNIRSGSGLTRHFRLDSTTMLADQSSDDLWGGDGNDWFWPDLPPRPPYVPRGLDKIHDALKGEAIQ